ncbi:hypothetical protein DEU56DRAFT_753161 [Suillus clintonianus]|uniref:uncharacterized protein n=1 Tax=Suillus clintonianus TaxID=1904413 RepID=UPI001B87B0D5|nr:uncharacterized protein DEU56DRAFT_753161 [Suillus clintonianus]KAG2148935.1 hypothetical protein DEU56DRAFT_753161 [Suillus clintonianus]
MHSEHPSKQPPAKFHLLSAISSLQMDKNLTHRELCEKLQLEHPTWYISSKRVNKLKSESMSETIGDPCIAVKIAGDISLSTSVTEGLLLLLTNLTPILQSRPTSNLAALKFIRDNLPVGTPQEPLILFPREQHIIEWYYHIYYTIQESDERPFHPVMLEIYGKKRCPRGALIIVKNGDGFLPDAPKFDMDINDLGRTLWWYIKSGKDPVTEASERQLMHYIEQSDGRM